MKENRIWLKALGPPLAEPSQPHQFASSEVQVPGANLEVCAAACCFTLVIQQLLALLADDVCLGELAYT